MIRLAHLAFAILLATILLIGSTTVYAQIQPKPDHFGALGFGTCEDRPCFMGIAPRVTGWTEVLKSGFDQSGFAAKLGDAADFVYFDQQRQHVTVVHSVGSDQVLNVSVRLATLERHLSAGETVKHYGS